MDGITVLLAQTLVCVQVVHRQLVTLVRHACRPYSSRHTPNNTSRVNRAWVSLHPISSLCHAHRGDLDYRREPATFVHYKPDTSVGLVFLFHTKRNFLNSGRTSSSPCSNTCANRLFKVAMNSDGSLRCWCAAAHASCGRVRRAKHLRELIGHDSNRISQNFRGEKT